MEDEIGGNQRRRSTDQNNNREDEMVTGSQYDEAHLPLSLSLGSASYSTQISPSPSLRLAPPSPIPTWPPPGFIPPPFFMSNSLYQLPYESVQANFLPPAPPPSNQTQARPVRSSVTSDDQSRRSVIEKIPAPFPWATNVRGKIQSLEELESKQITTITGDVQCKHCENVYQISYNLREKFEEVENIFKTMTSLMRDRAPSIWKNPVAMRCDLCGREKAVKPVIADRKSKINWLFLLLGQTLGYCTLEQLKNFCKHSKSHRTGAKDRVLYLTYLGLCKMLKPKDKLFH